MSFKSYKSRWSKQVQRRCPHCRRKLQAELVDYGRGGQLLFFACGHVRAVTQRKAV